MLLLCNWLIVPTANNVIKTVKVTVKVRIVIIPYIVPDTYIRIRRIKKICQLVTCFRHFKITKQFAQMQIIFKLFSSIFQIDNLQIRK